jgi:hypothetical protein
MDVFDLRSRLVEDYGRYTRSFIKIADPRVKAKVDGALDDGALWPEPLLQLNPTFLPGGTIDDLVADGTLHPECKRIFRIDKSDSDHSGKQLLLHAHQAEAIRKVQGRKVVRPHKRHWIGQEPDVHRADRGPRAPARIGSGHSGSSRLSDERARQ